MKKIFYLLLAILFSQTLFAQTKTWVGGTSGALTDWNTAANWSPAGVPASTDAVLLNANYTNDPVISTNVTVKSIDISNSGAALTVEVGATLTVSNVGNAINMAAGLITNNGTIDATNTRATQPGQEGALRMTEGTFYNYGTLILNGGNTYGISASGANSKSITCYSGSTTTINATDGFRFTNSSMFLDIRSGATVTANGTVRGGFLNPGRVQCAGKLTINGSVESYGSSSEFKTANCGSIIITGNLGLDPATANGAVTNAGYMNISGNLGVGSTGAFTNNGVLKYGTTSGSAITNRRALVFDTGSPTGIFAISTLAGNTTNIGIFSDANATVSAGSYNATTNTFQMLPTYNSGTYQLYAKLTQITCTYIVPFNYTRASTQWFIKTVSSGTGDGRSWANAASDIQATIISAIPGDSIFIAAGVYKPLKDGSGNASPTNVQNKVFWLKTGIKLIGGFAGTETSFSQRVLGANKTIFSGDIDNNDTNTDGNNIAEVSTDIQGTNVYQLLVMYNCDKYTAVDGIILTAAQGVVNTSGSGQSINGATIFPYFGSAMNITTSFPVIKSCVFSGNKSYYGTVYHNNLSTPYIDSVRVISSVFVGNNTTLGGGMFIHRGNSYLNNVVMHNNNSGSGGAINVSSNMDASGKITIVNSTFVNNYSSNSSIKSFRLENGIVKFYNDIIYNAVPYVGGSFSITGATVTSSYSNLQNSKDSGVWNNGYGTDGGNNYDQDPLFLNIALPAGADGNYFTSDDGLNVTSCSPAINSGTNYVAVTYPSVTNYDILGNTRPYSAGVADMGAYEFQGASTRPDDPTSLSSSSYAVTCGQSVTLSATCATGTVTWYLTAGGGTSIGTGSGLTTIPLTNPTTYYASCELSGTCISLNRVAMANIAVTLPADPTDVSASNTAICPSTQISLSATCTGGAVPEWYNGATALGTGSPLQVTPTTTTTYSVKCKSGVCYSVAGSVLVNVLSAPTSLSYSTDYLCSGQSITLTTSCVVGVPQWYDSQNGGNFVGAGTSITITPGNLAYGYYRYYPSCSNGSCTSSRYSPNNSFLFFPTPTSVAVSQTSFCQGQNTTISLSATCGNLSTVRWYDSVTGGSMLGTGSPLSQTPTVTTTYYAECFNTNAPCSTTRIATQQVVIGVPVTAPTGVSVDKTAICANTSISLSATCATGIVRWYNQATGGTALGTGSPFAQSPSSTTTYFASCESGACTPSSRVATSQVSVVTVGSNLNLTTNISGTAIHASSNTITATNTIQTGANVKYLANNSITLNPQSGGGFQVTNGAVFEAKIMPLTGCN